METFDISVSGRIFTLSRLTADKFPMIKSMIEDLDVDNQCRDNSGNMIFIERSPAAFEEVLSFVLDPAHKVPNRYEYELKFHLIEYTKDNLLPSNADLLDENQKLLEKIEKNHLATSVAIELSLYAPTFTRLSKCKRCCKDIYAHAIYCSKCVTHAKCNAKDCDKKSHVKSSFCEYHRKKCTSCGESNCRIPNFMTFNVCVFHLSNRHRKELGLSDWQKK
jgi:hypothetical protein